MEVIVDEVQDCSADDVLVLELLNDHGVTIIAVGDPDQSIYAFRSDEPANLTPFLDKLPRGERLNGNFRSSPAICSAVDSLRVGTERDDPIGRNAEVDTPVVLVSYDSQRELAGLLERASVANDIPTSMLVVLAHSADHARQAAGAGSDPGAASTSNKLVSMARAHHAISGTNVPGAERVAAMRSLERTIRELGHPDVVELEQAAYLEACGLTERAFREACLRVATSLPRPFEMQPSVFRAKLVELTDIQELLRWSPRSLRSPSGGNWPSGLTAEHPQRALMYSTIHGMKGRQAAAVALVLPSSRRDDDGLKQWREGRIGEERRVLYVGASRAERLLVVAAHASIFEAVQSQLHRDNVATSLFQ